MNSYRTGVIPRKRPHTAIPLRNAEPRPTCSSCGKPITKIAAIPGYRGEHWRHAAEGGER